MDFVYGSKVTNKAQIEQQGLLAKDVALLGLDLYMKQVFEFGFFHADPHPGNILLTPDGRIAFIDLGAMGNSALKNANYLEIVCTMPLKKCAKNHRDH